MVLTRFVYLIHTLRSLLDNKPLIEYLYGSMSGIHDNIRARRPSVMGASAHAPRHRNSMYVQTVRRSIYDTRQPEHPHSPIRQYEQRPQGPPFTASLHGILTGHGPTLRYVYIYVYIYFYIYNSVNLRRRHDHCEHCTAASRYFPQSHQISDVIPVIGRSLASHSFLLDLTHDFRFN